MSVSSLNPPTTSESRQGGQGPPTSLPFPATSRENLRIDSYLDSPCRIDTIHLQAIHVHMSSSEFEPRAYGTTVSVINHYNVWATILLYKPN
ncbi:hypothetical protein TNCV_1983681 [Trichonephila clavipes]|nr:hypothetical protein TNCV_1983681 [Trichonephila clavipes]